MTRGRRTWDSKDLEERDRRAKQDSRQGDLGEEGLGAGRRRGRKDSNQSDWSEEDTTKGTGVRTRDQEDSV